MLIFYFSSEKFILTSQCAEVVRPIMALLHPECKALENFEALMALTNLAGVSPSVRYFCLIL